MPDTLKFTDDEVNEIRFLQNKFQEKLLKFGQIQLETIELEDKLTNKYGEGSLNLKEGTFTPSK